MNRPPDLSVHTEMYDKLKQLKNNSPGPKYLIMQRKNGGDLLKVSPFLLKKVIDYTCNGEVEMCKKLRNGNVIIKTKNETQAKKLIQLINLSGSIEVEISEHNFLNSSKGVIYSSDLIGVPEAEILDGLKKYNVIEVKKIMKNIGTSSNETGLITLTFSTAEPPTDIYAGYENVAVRPFIPNPLRCFNCFMFGHPTKFCKNEKSCCNCNNLHHINLETNEKCDLPMLCVNCAKNNIEDKCHNSLDRKCPIFLREKEIQAIKTLQKVDTKTAKQIYQNRLQYKTVIPSTRTITNYSSLNTFSNLTPQRSESTNNNNSSTSTSSFSKPSIEATKPTASNNSITSNAKNSTVPYSTLNKNITPSCNASSASKISTTNKTVKVLPRNASQRLKRQLKTMTKTKSKSKIKHNADTEMDTISSDGFEEAINNI